MPRTLPWLTNPASDKTPKKLTPGATARKKNDADAAATPRPRNRDFFRSSPTPPSSPIHRCPSEESPIEGLDHDDIYMMVEDEFYAVAQTFTQHLHYAEYVRRKKEAKRQNADAIRQLARPTDGVTPVSPDMIRRDAAEALARRQDSGLEQMAGRRPRVDSEEEGGDEDDEDDDEADDAFAGTSLHGLMTSPRKARSLVGMQGVRSTTRAAAGFLRAGTTATTGEETRSEEDDDLDAPPRGTPTAVRVRPGAGGPETKTGTKASSLGVRGGRTPPPQAQIQTTEKRREQVGAKKRGLLFDDEFDQLPELGRPDKAARQSARPRSMSGSTSIDKTENARRSEGSNRSRLNEVPTFLL
ncbi:hypothetical protein BDV59DRAFT_26784 [Aspergillus ambiguus]|uniref:uncharacterized protein n=1 Tax=Aspergillus ambiguus TaxID=176160 RepID=UPI003CCDCB78